jgi:hypothetical protein
MHSLRNKPFGARFNIDAKFPQYEPYFHAGSMTAICSYCNALGFSYENRSRKKSVTHFGELCCNQGKVSLAPYPDLPQNLYNLFVGNSPEAKHFQKKHQVLQFWFGNGIYDSRGQNYS